MQANHETMLQRCRNAFLQVALLSFAYLGVAAPQTSSDATKVSSHGNASQGEAHNETPSVSVTSQDGPKASQPAVRDGSHDFDFIYGKWRMPNHRLVKRLAGSHEWVEFISCTEGAPLVGGIGDVDVFRTNYWKDFVGITVRTYDPATGLWRSYWFEQPVLSWDNRSASRGQIQWERGGLRG